MWKWEVSAQEAVPAPSPSSDAGFGIGEGGRGKRQLWLSEAAFSCVLLVLDGAGWVMVTLWVPQDKYPPLGPAEPPVVGREPGTPQGWDPQSCRGEQQRALVKSPKVQQHCRCQHLVFL